MVTRSNFCPGEYHGKAFSVVAFRSDTDQAIIVGDDQGDFVQTPEQTAKMLRQGDGIKEPTPPDVVEGLRARIVRYRVDRERMKIRAWSALLQTVPPSSDDARVTAFVVTDGRLRVFDASSDPELSRRFAAWDSAQRRLRASITHLFDNAK